MCLGCREMKPKTQLVRVVKSKDGEFFVDLTGKKSGRGAYVCKSVKCFETTIKAKRLEKAFEGAVDKNIYEELKIQIENVVTV